MRLSPTPWLLLSLLLVYALPRTSSAQPYEFHAHFGGDGIKEPRVRLEAGDIVPAASISQQLKEISIRIKDDDISRSLRSQLAELSIDVTCESEACAAALKRPMRSPKVIPFDKEEYKDEPLLRPDELGGSASVERVRIDLQSTFRRDFLCAEELRLRKEEGRLITRWQERVLPFLRVGPEAEKAELQACDIKVNSKNQAPDEVEAAEFLSKKSTTEFVECLDTSRLQALATFALSGFESNGVPLLYSFCENVTSSIDWSALYKSLKPAGVESPDKLQAEQAMALAQKLKQRLESKAHFGKVVIDALASGEVKLKISAEHRFTLLRELGSQFAFKEREHRSDDRLEAPVDQDSIMLVHNIAPAFCNTLGGGCKDFFKKYISASILSQNGSGTEVREKVDLRFSGDNHWALQTSLTKYLRQKVRFVLTYNNADNELDVLRTEPVSVEDFGLNISFPVITEVVSLVQQSRKGGINPEENDFQSSIPISWAFNVDETDGKNLALTIPFMVGYNPRTAPRLSDVIKFFPHVSVVFPLSSESGADGEGKPDVAFGAGVALADAFSLSWGLATSGNQYVLLGVSIPDLVNIPW